MNREDKYSYCAGFVAAFAIWLGVLAMAVFLSGCVRATYNATPGGETFTLWSVLKSVDGLAVDREGEDFSLDIDKTHSQNPMADMVEMIKMIENIRSGGSTDTDPEDN